MNEWAISEIEKQKNNSKDYREIALLETVLFYLEEQEQRQISLQGQLEGQMWSPSNW